MTDPPIRPSPNPAGAPAGAGTPFNESNTPYDALGGEPGVRALADAFYDRMETDAPTVRALHPGDLTESRQKFFEFLSGWLCGPQLYMSKHGHPRLRMRHNPFPIDQAAADEWIHCMSLALDDCGIRGPVREFLDARFSHVANFLKNR